MGDEHVFGLDVAMKDLCVGGGEGRITGLVVSRVEGGLRDLSSGGRHVRIFPSIR